MRLVDRAAGGAPRRVRLALDWLVTGVVAVAFVLAFEAEVARPFRIPSESMEPTLHCARPATGCDATMSDRVIACIVCYRLSAPARGQIVVFHAPALAATRCSEGGIYVKRLIGLPGDTWQEVNGSVLIDGRKLAEPYVEPSLRDDRTIAPIHIPAGDYFMMGDNRANSCDSRSWGVVPRSALIGPVVLTYWPPDRLTIR